MEPLKIARHAVDGLSHKQIGKILDISPVTVRDHLSRVYRKLEVSNNYSSRKNCKR